ncbi:hypothetical protein [Methanobacterium sp.]|uniref:hypothetical protein n=1 Tax=Methanobacterium sp. TaxID=2164 RepID=UPI003C72FCFE
MKVHPVISIFSGIIAIFIMLSILGIVTGQMMDGISSISGVILFFIFIIGGFIATYFSKDERIRYGAYSGLILSVLVIIIGHNYLGSNGIFMALADIVLISLTTGFGGFIAKLSEKNYRESFKTKNFTNGFSPIFAVIAGFIVATLSNSLLEFIFGINTLSTVYGVNDFITGIISLFIGGFVTTYLVKDEKIQYAIYVVIIAIIAGLLKLYVEIVHGSIITESNYYYIRIASIVGYIIFAVIGGYLGIILSKHLNKK